MRDRRGRAAVADSFDSAQQSLRVPRYEANPRDPVVLSGAVLAMSALGVVATWIPARRALSLDPLILLRDE